MNRILATLAAAAMAAASLAVTTASPAHAAARISVVNDRGGPMADTRYATELTINGSGFQVVKGGFGGVYLMFGWVDDPAGGSWKPSRGGRTGSDYRYIPDSENAADNRGYLKFISFPGSSTAGEAQAVLSESGGFRVQLTVPGPVFDTVDRSGKVVHVDCRRVTCGVITIGAHGVKNPANETFTRVDFGNVYDSAPQAEQPQGSTPEASGPEAEQAPRTGNAGSSGRAVTAPGRPVGRAGVTADRATAVVGRALAFTGRGFIPGEQVLAILDDGIASLGPMVAGESGEVAGVIQLPADLEPGTHELRLSGAASLRTPTERFPVAAGAEALQPVADSTTEASSDTEDRLAQAFFVVALLVFAGALFSMLRARRRASRRAGAVS